MCAKLDMYEIVMKLIGPVDPVGETRADDIRFENLKHLVYLTEKLLNKIDYISYHNKNAHQFSLKRTSDYCKDFYDRIGIDE